MLKIVVYLNLCTQLYLIYFQLCIRSMAQVDCIGPMKIGMKIRRDSIALAAEALGKMFDKGEEDLVQQVKQGSHRLEKYLNIQDCLERP